MDLYKNISFICLVFLLFSTTRAVNLGALFSSLVKTNGDSRISDAEKDDGGLEKGDSKTSEPENGDSKNGDPGNGGKGNDDSGVFDVTKYGAIADGKTDSRVAFVKAWEAACKYAGSATFLVPEGEFLVGPTAFQGPCFNSGSPKVEIQGKLTAVTNLQAYKGEDWLTFRDVRNLEVSGGGTVDGQGPHCWASSSCDHSNICKVLPTSLKFSKVINVKIHDLDLVDSKGFHVSIFECSHVDIYNMKIRSPADSPNTDGIHVSSSFAVNIFDSNIGVGDDCISLGPGCINNTITNIVCGPGHGISVGSLGKYTNERNVIGLTVKHCTINGADNGVRIKTWAGSQASVARDFVFEDITMNDVSNPIIIDQEYCPNKPCTKVPSKVQIQNVIFKNIKGTSSSEIPVMLKCSEAVPCRGISLSDIDIHPPNGGTIKATCLNVKFDAQTPLCGS